MNIGGFEIERKFLIAMPDEAFLKSCDCSEITQTYLLGEENTTERVRRRVYRDKCEYTHTIKRKLNDMRRVEDEREVDERTYSELLKRADPARQPIQKTRCCFEQGGKLWELDVFPFWKNQAYLEIELTDEEEDFVLPYGIRLLREVTDDPRYTNAALSLEIPNEDSDE